MIANWFFSLSNLRLHSAWDLAEHILLILYDFPSRALVGKKFLPTARFYSQAIAHRLNITFWMWTHVLRNSFKIATYERNAKSYLQKRLRHLHCRYSESSWCCPSLTKWKRCRRSSLCPLNRSKSRRSNKLYPLRKRLGKYSNLDSCRWWKYRRPRRRRACRCLRCPNVAWSLGCHFV